MSKKIVTLLLVCLLTLGLTCASAETTLAVADMYGREIVLAQPATRVVALTAADCEILCALGGEELLVGRGTYCDYPASIQDVPVVESGFETNIEQIIALQPQVVLMGDMAQPVEHVEALEAAGIRVVVGDANDIAGVYTAIRTIGQIVGLNDEAEALIADMQATFDDIRERSAASDAAGKTVYFEISPLEWGLWTGGANTFMDELARMCGLVNAFADVDGWAQVSEEQVLERNPDFIVTTTMYYGEGPLPADEILARESWQAVTAVENGDVLGADSDEITRPGPRLKDAALALYNFINDVAEEASEPAV